jgi:predicted TPR repeat methyltransferase
MDDARDKLERILRRCDEGGISPPIALMEMLIETEDPDLIAELLRTRAARSGSAPAIRALEEANAAGCARVAAMLRSGVDSPPENASVEEGVAFCRRLFDWSVRQSEEASVALYSLCNPALLQAATREIVDLFERWGSLGPAKSVLDIGCGIGRMEEALSPKLEHIHAIDVSEEMIAVARRRCTGLGNVVLSTCSGLDLRGLPDEGFDFVFAVDSFPYLVQSGMPLVVRHFAEAARVLRAEGEFAILNFSYRADGTLDRRDVESLSRSHGFEMMVSGETPLPLWNAPAFRMRKSTA